MKQAAKSFSLILMLLLVSVALSVVIAFTLLAIVPCSWFGTGNEGACAYGAIFNMVVPIVILGPIPVFLLLLKQSSKQDKKNQSSLAVYGYNHTDIPIEDYSIDGRFGENLPSNTLRTDGVGRLVLDFEGKHHLHFTIKWTLDKRTPNAVQTWRERELSVCGPFPANAAYSTVHFYSDRLELTISNDAPEPCH